jgi:nucleoside-diphosphate-sugar epimerase
MALVFVTGGSGFVGGRLIERLLADGHTVRALARSSASAERVSGLGAEPVAGELADRDALLAGAQGCELAFHAAATLGDSGSREQFERGNVHGTQNVLWACEQAGVGRLVHISTEAVLFAGQPLVQVDETAPLQPDSKALYSATKARAEQAVIAANGERLQTVAVRPRFVWGAGDTTLLPRMAEMVRSGRFAWIAGGRHLTSTTHIDNTVEGLVLAAERGRPGDVYFVTDGEPVVFRDFVGELLATQGLDAPTRSIPGPLARVLMEAGEAGARLLPGEHPPPLSRFAYWVSSQECTIRIDKAREQLGYAPVRDISEGLAGLRAAASTA